VAHDPPDVATGAAVETTGACTVAAVVAEDEDEALEVEAVLETVEAAGVLDSDGSVESSDSDVVATAVVRFVVAALVLPAVELGTALTAVTRCVVFVDSAARLPVRACFVALAAIPANTAQPAAASAAVSFVKSPARRRPASRR
jgi:hypothetical protein